MFEELAVIWNYIGAGFLLGIGISLGWTVGKLVSGKIGKE